VGFVSLLQVQTSQTPNLLPHRVLGIVCTSPGWGGLEMNTLRLVGWLRERGWKVHLLTAGGAPIQAQAGDMPSSVQAMREKGVPGRGGQLRVLHAWARRYKIRALLVPYRSDLKAASLYKRFYDSDMALIYQQHMQLGRSKRNLIHTLRYQMIDAWIAPLQYLKEETLRLTRVPEEKIEVIPFGIDTAPFTESASSRADARSLLGLPPDGFIVGVLGRLDPKKGQMLVLQALEKMRAEGKPFELLLMGDATLDAGGETYALRLREFVSAKGLDALVHFRSSRSEVMSFFRAIDVFAMPSFGETFGMVTIEAMAAGVPVLGADSDGTRELLGSGCFGWLFQNENVASFCAELQALRSGSDTGEKVNAAQAHVLTTFNKDRMTARIEALLLELLATPEM
jgi:glycosyltransferase involved in cell wall biosynthesis